MKRGGYPTREAIEEATAWAEAHPANAPDPCAGHSCEKCDRSHGDICSECKNQPGALSGECCFEPIRKAILGLGPDGMTVGEVCTCGHVHDGCEGCEHDDGRYYNGPCLICHQHAGSHPASRCYYTPAKHVCPKCGKVRR